MEFYYILKSVILFFRNQMNDESDEYLLHNTEHRCRKCKLSLLVQALMFQRNIVFVQSKRFLIHFTLQKEGRYNIIDYNLYTQCQTDSVTFR